jgi:uncharacterized protein YqiB (DUF1249 family)
MLATKPNLLAKLLKRRDFTGLMELYEINYRLLCRLVPALAQAESSAVSQVEGSPDLHLKVEERSKFTTTFSLTYYFESAAGEPVSDPDLRIRVYHDARLAETMSCRRSGFMAMDPKRAAKRSEVDCKWESNLFLEKWLAYTLAQGHCFAVHATSSDRPAVESLEAF